MSVTLTSSRLTIGKLYGLSGIFWKSLAALSVFACVVATPVSAAQHEGFFDKLIPDIDLPKIDIPFWTDDLKKATRAYNRGNYPRALKFFNKESEDGNIIADWYLGHMHRLGQGVPVDDAVAYSYYSRVAESYDPEEPNAKRLRVVVDSQIRLAHYIRDGVPQAGIKSNPERAAKAYLRLSSNYGHPEAMYSLGAMNVEGNGIRKNPQQGLKWLLAAARKRHAEAEAYLGELYAKGEVVRKDDTRALMWYILATSNADKDQQSSIEARFNELNWSASPEVKLEAEARAKVWADQYPVGGN